MAPDGIGKYSAITRATPIRIARWEFHPHAESFVEGCLRSDRWYGKRHLRFGAAHHHDPGNRPKLPLAHYGKLGYVDVINTKGNMTLIETDDRSRVVLPGHPSQRFVLRENEDGSILLEPARVVTEAQLEYDESPELQALLRRAAASETVSRARRRR